MSKSHDLEPVEVPLLISQPTRILFGMTGRQVLVLVYALAICLALWQSVAPFQSLAGVILLVCVCLIPATLIAFLKIGSRPLEQWLCVMLIWMLTPEHFLRDHLVRTFVKVRRIEEGVVALDLDDGSDHLTYQAVIAVQSRSFDLLGNHEQEAIIQLFRKVLDGLSYPVTIHVRTLPTRPSALSSTILPFRLSDPLRRFHAHYLSFLSRVVQEARPVHSSFYVIILADQKNKEQAKVQLNSRVQELSRELVRVGLSCRSLSSTELFAFYHQTFLPQVQPPKTLSNALLQDGNQLPGMLAPHEIFITASSLEIEGSQGRLQYLACLALDELPRKISPGWLHRVLAMNEPFIDVSLHLRPQESDVVANQLRRRAIMMSGTLLAAKQQGHGDDPGEGNTITRYALKDIERVRDQLIRKDTHLYSIALLFLVRGVSREDLGARVHRVQLALRSLDFQASMLHFQQHLGYFSSLGYGQNILDHYRHLLPTDAAATFYPFRSSPKMDDQGVLLGITANKSLVSFDPYGPGKLNANMAVLGVPGSGKSFFLKTILSRLAPEAAISIIDVEDEYTHFIEAIGGQKVALTADSFRINPLELGKRDQTRKEHAFREKITMLIGFFALLIGENGLLTQHESGVLHQCLLRTYMEAGITDDPMTHDKPAPGVQDVAVLLRQVEPASDLSLRLIPYVHLFPRRSHIPGVQHMVYSLKQLPESLQPAATYLITERLWNELQAGRQNTPAGIPRHLVVIDEAWFLSKFACGAVLLNDLARRIRKYNGGLWLGTQQLMDLLLSEQGKNLLPLFETKMLFRQDVSSSDAIQQILHLSEAQARYLRTAKQGEALYITSDDTIAVEILASEQETAMATTTQKKGI